MVKSGLFELITDDWSYAYHILICVIEDIDNFKDFVSMKYEISNEDIERLFNGKIIDYTTLNNLNGEISLDKKLLFVKNVMVV